MNNQPDNNEPDDPTGLRYYGSDMTIHGTGHVDVETDAEGNVVSVWFRCQPLPFRQARVTHPRAKDMRDMYRTYRQDSIEAVVLRADQ